MNQKKKELETNELANALGDRLEQLKPYGFIIGVITFAVLAAIILVAYLVSSSQSIESSRWQEFFLANDAGPQQLPDARVLENVANENEGTPVEAIALMRSADIDIFNSLRKSSENEEELNALLRRAKKNYGKVVDSTTKLDPMWKRRALHGLAYACESLGEFDAAKTHYKRLVEEAKDTPIYEWAVDGLNRVTQASVSDVVAGFEAWQPVDAAPGPSTLPRRPIISFPTDDEIEGTSSFGNPPPSTAPDFAPGDDDAPTPPTGTDNDGDETDSTENESSDNADDDNADDDNSDDENSDGGNSDSDLRL